MYFQLNLILYESSCDIRVEEALLIRERNNQLNVKNEFITNLYIFLFIYSMLNLTELPIQYIVRILVLCFSYLLSCMAKSFLIRVEATLWGKYDT